MPYSSLLASSNATIENNVQASGWGIYDIGMGSLYDFRVQKVGTSSVLNNDDEAIAAALKAGVPVREDGFVQCMWLREGHYNQTY